MADAAKKKVRFVGGTGENKDTGTVYIPDSKVTLEKQQPVAVDAGLAKELLSGDSPRFKGLKFEAVDDEKAKSEAKS